MVREDRILSETAVCGYPRGTKGEGWWLVASATSGEPGREDSLLRGSAGHEQT